MDNPLYSSEPFNRTHAWIDLLLLANSSDNFFFKRGIRVDIVRGQIGYDAETLAKRWQWSRGKVERFLKHLEKDGMVVRQKNNVTTLISICKYDDYQANDKANSKANDNANGHQTINQTDTNKNVKKEKKENNEENIYRQFDHLKILRPEFDKLVAEGYTPEQVDNILDRIENYKKNRDYKNLYMTAKNWLAKEPKHGTRAVEKTYMVFWAVKKENGKLERLAESMTAEQIEELKTTDILDLQIREPEHKDYGGVVI
jgi:predicted transcriptional regulator